MMGAFSGNGISTDTGNIANGLAAIQNGTSLDGQTTTDFQNALGAMGGLSKVSSLLGGGNSGLMSGLTGLMGGRRRLVDLETTTTKTRELKIRTSKGVDLIFGLEN